MYSFINDDSILFSGAPTIFESYSETFQLPDGSYVNCEILDTGGQEIYKALNRQYYQRADCCVLVYDITNEDSFKECKNYYYQEIINNCKKDIKVILVGNKTDLENYRKISTEEGAEFAEENQYYFKETSCENKSNVADAFETLIIMTNNDIIKKEKENKENNYEIKKRKKMSLSVHKKHKKSKKNFC